MYYTMVQRLVLPTRVLNIHSSLQKTECFLKVLFKIFGVLSKDSISDICYYFGLLSADILDILRPKMVFAVYYLSTDIVSVNNFVC